MTSMIANPNELRRECERLAARYPDAVPVALVCGTGQASKTHFLTLPHTATAADLAAAVNRITGAHRSKSLPLSVNGCVPSSTATLGALLKQSGEDYLHVTYTADKGLGGILNAVPCIGGLLDALFGDGC